MLDFYEVRDSLTLASTCSSSLSEKMGEETCKGFEQILSEKRCKIEAVILISYFLHVSHLNGNDHLGCEFALFVERIQASDHDISGLLQCHGLWWNRSRISIHCAKLRLLHHRVKGHSLAVLHHAVAFHRRRCRSLLTWLRKRNRLLTWQSALNKALVKGVIYFFLNHNFFS